MMSRSKVIVLGGFVRKQWSYNVVVSDKIDWNSLSLACSVIIGRTCEVYSTITLSNATCTRPSSRCLSSAKGKPHQALEASPSFPMIVAL